MSVKYYRLPVIGKSCETQGMATRTRTRLCLAVVLTGAFVAMLDTFIVNVAVPSIRQELPASYSDAELVVAGYTLTYAIGQITGGRLGDAYGRRRVFTLGLGAFTLASALCALAPNAAVLIIGRLSQGLGAALLTPQVLAIIRVSFAEGRARQRAFAAMGVVTGLASVLGQILGGLIVQADLWGLAWRPVFLINLPIGLAALLACPLVAESRAETATRLDRSGVLLSTIGLVFLVLPLVEGPQDGWPGWSVAMLAASVPVLAAFAADQARKSVRGRMPLVDTRLFRRRGFRVGVTAVLAFTATMPSLYLSFTVLLQNGYAASPLTAALDFAPLALAFSVVSLVMGLLAWSGSRGLLMTGAGLTVLGSGLAAVLSLTVRAALPVALIPALVLIGAGTGLFLTTAFTVVLGDVPDDLVGTGSGVLSTAQRLGNAIGVAVLEIPFLLTYHRLAGHAGPAVAYAHAFAALAVAVALTGLLVVALLAVR
jgi:EmrB/QacA subfamily drug resistance transporter